MTWDCAISLVFQPGGTTDENVFTDWTDLVAEASGIEGLKIIVFDNSFSGNPMSVPAGTYDFGEGAIFTGFIGRPTTVVELADGVVLVGVTMFAQNLEVVSLSTSPVISSTADGSIIAVARGATLRASGTAPFIEHTAAGGGGIGLVVVHGGVIATGAIEALSVIAPATVGSVFGDNLSRVEPSTLSGDAGATIGLALPPGAPSTAYSRTQPGIAGTLLVTYQSAQDAPYTVGAPVPEPGWHAMTAPVTLPLASQFAGPIHLQNTTAAPLLVTPSVGDTLLDALAAIVASIPVPGGVSLTFKSDGTSTWQVFV